MSKKTLKIIGFIATCIGFLASALGDWSNNKQNEQEIKEEVQKAVTLALESK